MSAYYRTHEGQARGYDRRDEEAEAADLERQCAELAEEDNRIEREMAEPVECGSPLPGSRGLVSFPKDTQGTTRARWAPGRTGVGDDRF